MDSTDIRGRQVGEKNISTAHYTVQNNRGGGPNIRNVFQQGNIFPKEVKPEDQDLNDRIRLRIKMMMTGPWRMMTWMLLRIDMSLKILNLLK